MVLWGFFEIKIFLSVKFYEELEMVERRVTVRSAAKCQSWRCLKVVCSH